MGKLYPKRQSVKIILSVVLILYLLWTYWRSVEHFLQFVSKQEYRKCFHQRRNYQFKEQTDPLYVTLQPHGRLGNWMYGYASLLGIAQANGYIPYLIESHPLHSLFKLSKKRDKPADCLEIVFDDRPCTFEPEFFNLPKGNISIEGYIQSWKYFRLIDQEIRQEFQLRKAFENKVKGEFTRLVGRYVRNRRTVISIHVRRGDVLKQEARKLGFCHAPKSYFANAMTYMLKKFPFSVFLVVSDDIEWCRENLKPPEVGGNSVPIVFSSGQSSEMDFGLLTLCNHSIISVGTFSWWGAWLANGHVVYYKDFPLKGTKLDYEMTKEDYFPSKWIAISSCVSMSHSFLLLFLLTFSKIGNILLNTSGFPF